MYESDVKKQYAELLKTAMEQLAPRYGVKLVNLPQGEK